MPYTIMYRAKSGNLRYDNNVFNTKHEAEQYAVHVIISLDRFFNRHPRQKEKYTIAVVRVKEGSGKSYYTDEELGMTKDKHTHHHDSFGGVF